MNILKYVASDEGKSSYEEIGEDYKIKAFKSTVSRSIAMSLLNSKSLFLSK